MPPITSRPTFDARRTPADPAKAGQQPAADVWGVGKKTVERLKEKLRLDPTATPTVADFAYADLDTFQLGSRQRDLLHAQQYELISGLHVKPEDASPVVAGALLATMNAAIDAALEGIRAGTEPKGFVQREIADFAHQIGMNYGIFGSVSMPTADELARATAMGMKVGDGETPLAVRRRDGDLGVVVVPVRPRALLAPTLMQMADGKHQHGFTSNRSDWQVVRGFVIEEPKEGFAKLKSLETQARDAAAAVWIDKDPSARRQRCDAFSTAIDKFSAAIDASSLGANHAAMVHGALITLRSIRDITLLHIDA